MENLPGDLHDAVSFSGEKRFIQLHLVERGEQLPFLVT